MALEKPVSEDFLYNIVKKVLNTKKIELEYKMILEELNNIKEEMIETNTTLSVLTKNIERTRQETEIKILTEIRSLMTPLLENIMHDDHQKKYTSRVEVMRQYMENMTSGLTTNLQGDVSLSSREIGIASMIKHGMTSEEIASHLYVSLETVRTHRRNIRRKLGIKGKKPKLTDYLQSL